MAVMLSPHHVLSSSGNDLPIAKGLHAMAAMSSVSPSCLSLIYTHQLSAGRVQDHG